VNRSFVQFVACCLALTALAGGLRFYRLGAWPFHSDELATIEEATSLVTRRAGPLVSQTHRLPRAVPVAYAIHAVNNRVFGETEFGSRVLMALFGTLTVVVVFAGLDRALDRPTALITAVLLAGWPEHVFFSQECRFYVIAFFLASVASVAGALAVSRRSAAWAAVAGVAGIGAMLSHTVSALALGGVFAAVLLAAWGARGFPFVRVLGVIFVAGLIAAATYGLYLRPLLKGWNADWDWQYKPAYSLAASAFRLGWPVALLALLGGVLALRRRDEQDRYWLTWAAVWAATCLVLPLLIPYRHMYAFPLTLGLFVLAGMGAGRVYSLAAQHSRLAAVGFAGVACLLNLPALASHYVDGSTSDYRTAARYVAAHIQPGDAILAHTPELFHHYGPECPQPDIIDIYTPPLGLEQLTAQMARSKRFWVVINYGRANTPTWLLQWLGEHCTHQLHLCRLRYDYAEFTTDVFLFERK
jgi:predicted membrane-bound mannosyltransferase